MVLLDKSRSCVEKLPFQEGFFLRKWRCFIEQLSTRVGRSRRKAKLVTSKKRLKPSRAVERDS